MGKLLNVSKSPLRWYFGALRALAIEDGFLSSPSHSYVFTSFSHHGHYAGRIRFTESLAAQIGWGWCWGVRGPVECHVRRDRVMCPHSTPPPLPFTPQMTKGPESLPHRMVVWLVGRTWRRPRRPQASTRADDDYSCLFMTTIYPISPSPAAWCSW